MKPVPFEYCRATSVSDACGLLAEDPEALLMAGGQTLMPMLAMRLARPTRVIDILRIPALSGIAAQGGHVTIGATTRQHAVETSAAVERDVPLLFRAIPWVGHPPTRRRGTVGGSIANGDPTAEIGLVATALGAEILAQDAAGVQHVLSADGFFVGPMMTALPTGTMVTALRFRIRANRTGVGTGFAEVAQRHGDYAIAAAAVELRVDADGGCADLRLAVGGASDRPVLLDLAALVGTRLDDRTVSDALDAAIATLDVMEDQHSSAAYRRRAARALGLRAIQQARTDAAGATWAEAA